jgi:hypothetical protein
VSFIHTLGEKMKSNDELYDEAVEAITRLFSDSDVSQRVAKSNLENLISEIEIMIDSLSEDE